MRGVCGLVGAGAAGELHGGVSRGGASLTANARQVVTIYIVDTVTGHILSRTRHKNARGPVTAVVCEHWAIYHYWSLAQAGRFELGAPRGSLARPVHMIRPRAILIAWSRQA